MKWVKAKPTKPGIYWWRERKKGRALLVNVYNFHGELCAHPVDTEDEFIEGVAWSMLATICGWWSDTAILRPED